MLVLSLLVIVLLFIALIAAALGDAAGGGDGGSGGGGGGDFGLPDVGGFDVSHNRQRLCLALWTGTSGKSLCPRVCRREAGKFLSRSLFISFRRWASQLKSRKAAVAVHCEINRRQRRRRHRGRSEALPRRCEERHFTCSRAFQRTA